MSQQSKILVIDGKSRSQYYTDLIQACSADWVISSPQEAVHVQPDTIDLALVSDEFHTPSSLAIRYFVKHHVPTLHVVDGIAEWRNVWENSRSLSADRGMPLFQPILAHKVACLGRSQARLLESWGNLGKCEIVGSPRFDRLLLQATPQRQRQGPLQVLVLTAKTPAFTERQRTLVKQSLLDLQTWFSNHTHVAGVAVTPVWRVTDGLAEELELTNSITDLTGKELATVLQSVDALIATPSTALLEGMLQQIPVALLDYNNCPDFVPAAWSITAPQHFDQVIPELLVPPAPRMLYQDTILHDALECRSPATERMVQLVNTMIEIGRVCKAQNRPLEFPDRILPDPQNGHHLPEERFDLQQLYPNHPVFGNMDRTCLQVEIGHLKLEVERLQKKLSVAETKLRSSYFWRARTKLSQLKHLLLSHP